MPNALITYNAEMLNAVAIMLRAHAETLDALAAKRSVVNYLAERSALALLCSQVTRLSDHVRHNAFKGIGK